MEKHPSYMGELRNRVAIWGACTYILIVGQADPLTWILPTVLATLPAVNFVKRKLREVK